MQILVPTTSCEFTFDGAVRRWVRGRTTIEEGHPILKGREHLVEPLRIDYPAPEKKQRATAPASPAKK
ncbi:MAG TPA: hypothetical protein VF731_07405 [Solirubrobacterales bacterium]